MGRFAERVDQELEGIEHVSTGALDECDQCDGDEGGFSWSSCDACGSTLGGDRYPAHGLMQSVKGKHAAGLLHLDVCVDCLMYLANGDEPEED